MNAEVNTFPDGNEFKCDDSRPQLGNIITSPVVNKILVYDQMNYYFLIKG